MPANSNHMITVPASLDVNPFASWSIVGPQSATNARAALIMKLQSPSIQITGLRKTAWSIVRLSDCRIA